MNIISSPWNVQINNLWVNNWLKFLVILVCCVPSQSIRTQRTYPSRSTVKSLFKLHTIDLQQLKTRRTLNSLPPSSKQPLTLNYPQDHCRISSGPSAVCWKAQPDKALVTASVTVCGQTWLKMSYLPFIFSGRENAFNQIYVKGIKPITVIKSILKVPLLFITWC